MSTASRAYIYTLATLLLSMGNASFIFVPVNTYICMRESIWYSKLTSKVMTGYFYDFFAWQAFSNLPFVCSNDDIYIDLCEYTYI